MYSLSPEFEYLSGESRIGKCRRAKHLNWSPLYHQRKLSLTALFKHRLPSPIIIAHLLSRFKSSNWPVPSQKSIHPPTSSPFAKSKRKKRPNLNPSSSQARKIYRTTTYIQTTTKQSHCCWFFSDKAKEHKIMISFHKLKVSASENPLL